MAPRFWFVDAEGKPYQRPLTEDEGHLYRTAFRRGVVDAANAALLGGMITNDQKSDLYAAIWPQQQEQA